MKNIDRNSPANTNYHDMVMFNTIDSYFKKNEQDRREAEKAKMEIESQERLFRHEWKIAIFNTIAGGVAGLITSVIFWLISK